MDELIYKAKTTEDKKWVEGYFFRCPTINQNKSKIEKPFLIIEEDGRKLYEIDFKTLCRNTGLKDKNGDNIWENDLILYNELQPPYIVKWNREQAKYEFQTEEGYAQAGFNEMTMKNCEIIGNIFDE